MAGAGVSGVAVGTVAAGAFLLWSGIRNVTVVDGLRELAAGRLPAEGPQSVSSGTGGIAQGLKSGGLLQGGGAVGGALVAEARRHLGKPYVWSTEGPNTFDCSGLVVYCLNQVGVKVSRLTAAGFLVWPGATTISRADMQPGDLVCWGGHIGIAASATTMIEAPNRRNPVREGKIWTPPSPSPTIRRVTRAVAASSPPAGTPGRLGGGR